jgi:plastocyanin
METKTPENPAMRRFFGRRGRSRIGLLATAAAIFALPIAAIAAGPVTVKGKTVGGGKLINPVWEEARDPKLQRYTFREPSATVRADVRALTAFLPKEVCIAALIDGEAQALKAPLRVVVAGGRTSPVTLVVAKGQQIQFENQDPFPHKLYVVGADPKGFGATEQGAGKARGWTPPGPGRYEIRDQLAPSVRSWIVVEPHAAAVAYPDRKGDFQIDLDPGKYKLHAYFKGEPVGSELEVNVTPAPMEQLLKGTLALGEVEAPPAPGKPGKAPAAPGGGN